MNFENLLMAFGGGVFASLIGGTNAFILTGFTGLAGIAIQLATGDAGFLNTVAFGPFFNPPVAFAGGVAAAAYAGNKYNEKKERNIVIHGADVLMPLFKTKDPIVFIIGGLFAMLGYTINYYASSVRKLPIDTGALGVFTCGLLSRFLFTDSGLTGKFGPNEKRYGDMTGNFLLFTAIWGFFYSFLVGKVTMLLGMNNIGFCISAASLIFLYSKEEFSSSHHVAMVAGYAATVFANPYMAGLFGCLAALFGEWIGRTINTNVESHVDREATTILTFSIIILAIFGR